MRVKVIAKCGHPYLITGDGHNVYLHRRSAKGVDHGITLTSTDVIAVCNAIVDIAERQQAG